MLKGNKQQEGAGPKFPKPVKREPKPKVLATTDDLNHAVIAAAGIKDRCSDLVRKVAAGLPITRRQITAARKALATASKRIVTMELVADLAVQRAEDAAATAKAKLDRAQARFDKVLADTNAIRKEQGLAPLGADGKEVQE